MLWMSSYGRNGGGQYGFRGVACMLARRYIALEKASFKALHGAAQAQRTLYANQPPLPLLSDASQHRAGASTGSPHHGEGGGTGTGRRKEAKRSASYHASPQRSPKAPKALR